MPNSTRRARMGALLPIALLALAGCPSKTGDIDLSVAFTGGGAPGDVDRVTAQVLTEDGHPLSPAVSMDLEKNAGRWQGLLESVPSGQKLLRAEAFAANGSRLYHGDALVDVAGGKTLFVFLQLQWDGASQNHAPFISSVVVSSISVDFGKFLSLSATVGDPDPDDVPRLQYSWTATAGTFLDPTNRLSVTWQAPPGPQPLVVTFTFRVTDPAGLSAVISIDIGVQTGVSDATAVAVANSWPRIDRIASNSSVASIGALVELTSSAHDADGDAVHFRWSSVDCPGTFLSPADRPDTEFQLGALGLGASCSLALDVDDARGGTDQARIVLSAGPPGTAALPIVDSASNGGTQGFTGRPVELTLQAHDPLNLNGALTFDWETVGAVVDGVQSQGTRSTLTVHVTPCGGPARATVNVARAGSGASLSFTFEITTCSPSCKELKAATPTLADGTYQIDPDGPVIGSVAPVTVFCDMTTDGGGWTFVGYYAASTSGAQIFNVPTGTYLPSRAEGNTYSLGNLPFFEDTEMMISADHADPVAASQGHSLVFFRYPVEHENFNLGPAPCTSIRPFEYRTALSGAYFASGEWACTGSTWVTRDRDGRDLVKLGGPGVFLGEGVLATGMAPGWGHSAWIYVR